MKKIGSLALLALCAVMLTGCASTAQFFANTAAQLSSSTPAQVTSYEVATQAATLAADATDIAVNTLDFDKGTLTELTALNEAVHAAWLDLKAAHDRGASLTFSSFQAALDAFNAYATSKGVPR